MTSEMRRRQPSAFAVLVVLWGTLFNAGVAFAQPPTPTLPDPPCRRVILEMAPCTPVPPGDPPPIPGAAEATCDVPKPSISGAWYSAPGEFGVGSHYKLDAAGEGTCSTPGVDEIHVQLFVHPYASDGSADTAAAWCGPNPPAKCFHRGVESHSAILYTYAFHRDCAEARVNGQFIAGNPSSDTNNARFCEGG